MSILKVENLGKAYLNYTSEWKRVLSWFGAPFTPQDVHWVIRDINFEVYPGESVGIIGQNGAGKSTLLKMITGTQKPTEGKVTVNGRVSAILELGMGFNPEFTGRQNALHALGMMGFSRENIDSVMSDVEEFSEIGEYFDLPVRTYSSGMQMRVAFAVATAFRSELLIVDEALSVGDSYFQHKSYDRIREFQKKGTSLLLVSHDRNAIQSVCSRAILIGEGGLVHSGSPKEVIDYYNALIADQERRTIKRAKVELIDGAVETKSGSGEAEIEAIKLVNSQSKPVEVVNVGERVSLVVNVKINKDIEQLVFGYLLRDRYGRDVYGTNTFHTKQILKNLHAGERFSFSAEFYANIGVGNYSFSVALTRDDHHALGNYEWKDLALVFDVENHDKVCFAGNSWIEPVITIES